MKKIRYSSTFNKSYNYKRGESKVQKEKKFKIRKIGKKYNHMEDNWLGTPE